MKPENTKNSIVDYMNGHLSDEQLKSFEDELNQDPNLMKELNDAKNWQSQLQNEQLDTPTPQFSSIENKLTSKAWNFKNWGIGLSTAASITLVALFSFDQVDITNNEFETLTNSQNLYSEPVIQMVLSENTNIKQFVKEYNLSVVQMYPNTQIIDVKFNYALNQQLSTLTTDKRIILTKKIGGD